MVKKYPRTINDMKRRSLHVPASEIKFFNLLDSLDDNWSAWHSVILSDIDLLREAQGRKKKRTGEADFVLYHREHGFIVVEVKGGLINCEEGDFFSTELNSTEKHGIKDPFRQAQEATYFIKDYFMKRAQQEKNKNQLLSKTQKGYKSRFHFAHAVFFPDTEFKKASKRGMQNDLKKVFDKSDAAEHLEAFLLSLFPKKKPPALIKRKELIEDFFASIIMPTFTNHVDLKLYYAARENELIEVNKIQDFLLSALSKKLRCVFQGSAGSGKTYLALKKGLLSYQQGKKTLLVCYNRGLRDKMVEFYEKKLKVSHADFQKLQIMTIHQVLYKIIELFIDNAMQPSLKKLVNGFRVEELLPQISPLFHAIPDFFRFDVILIDEAQDVRNEMCELFLNLLKDKETSIFYLFLDFQQDIFSRKFKLEKFGMTEERDVILLNRNLRNTVEIAKWLKYRTTSGKYEEYSGIIGQKVSRCRVSSKSTALLKAMWDIKSLYYSQDISPERIIILSLLNLKSIIRKASKNHACSFFHVPVRGEEPPKELYVIEPNTLASHKEVRKSLKLNGDYVTLFKTVQSFKGLERDIVFLLVPNLDKHVKENPQFTDKFNNLIYTGASRAKFKLHVFEYND